VFTGRDPIPRSHFRIASCMAMRAMGAGVEAATVWRERTGQEQDLKWTRANRCTSSIH
jgi:hypothetical protein